MSTNLVSLMLDLVMMDMVDLVMMILKWVVAINSARDAGGRHCLEQFSRVSRVLSRVQLQSLECELRSRGVQSCRVHSKDWGVRHVERPQRN